MTNIPQCLCYDPEEIQSLMKARTKYRGKSVQAASSILYSIPFSLSPFHLFVCL